MKTALALQVASFSRSLTARVTTALILLLPALFSVGMVAVARASDASGPSAAKLEPYREGTFGEASAALAGQVVAVMALIGVGFAIAWLVGREWADRTLGSLFALPIARTRIAWAKVIVVAAWAAASICLAMALVAAGIALFGGGSLTSDVMVQLLRVLAAGLVTAALAIPFGWVAVATHGYLGAVATIIGVTAASQILASLGLGTWVPYVAPALWAGAGGADAAAVVGPAPLAVALAFACLGAWWTVRAFSRARLD
jgi:ABC-type transport system involved in multi-copper enzyme maturation permease subunit